MRVIYAFLAIRMLRLARFDLARSDMLYRSGDEAFKRSRERVRLAGALAARADLPQPRVVRSMPRRPASRPVWRSGYSGEAE